MCGQRCRCSICVASAAGAANVASAAGAAYLASAAGAAYVASAAGAACVASAAGAACVASAAEQAGRDALPVGSALITSNLHFLLLHQLKEEKVLGLGLFDRLSRTSSHWIFTRDVLLCSRSILFNIYPVSLLIHRRTVCQHVAVLCNHALPALK